MSPRYALLLILLLAGAVGSWYLARSGGDDADERPLLDRATRGYYLESARILGTAADGSLLYEIRADRAEQRGDDRIDFTDVHIRYSPEADVPWTVDADSATLVANGRERVQLSGHVRALSTRSGRETEIRTQYLELDPENYVAETDERVQIRIGSRSLTATGMLASLRDDRLELKSNVSGKFVP